MEEIDNLNTSERNTAAEAPALNATNEEHSAPPESQKIRKVVRRHKKKSKEGPKFPHTGKNVLLNQWNFVLNVYCF